MIYSASITTGANANGGTLVKTSLRITKGLVYRVELDFPTGSAGLLKVVIFDGSLQLWPFSVGEYFTGDGIKIEFEDVYLKESAPFYFDIYTLNLDTVYEHFVNIRIGFVSKEIFMARFLPHLSYKYFEEMLKRLQVEQETRAEEQRQEIIAKPFPGIIGQNGE